MNDNFFRSQRPEPQQKPADIKVSLFRPSTGSRLTFTVPFGTQPSAIIAEMPGWEFAENW